MFFEAEEEMPNNIGQYSDRKNQETENKKRRRQGQRQRD